MNALGAFAGGTSVETGRNKHSLDPRGEADDWEEEPVRVEILKHALNRLPVDPEGDAGSAQVQAAAHHVLRGQDVLVERRNRPRYTACLGKTQTHGRPCEIRSSE